MSLQLIDFNDEIEYIDIDASLVPYSFSIKLEDRTYEMTVKYNEIGGFYMVDLFDLNGEVLAFGEIVRYGRPLFTWLKMKTSLSRSLFRTALQRTVFQK